MQLKLSLVVALGACGSPPHPSTGGTGPDPDAPSIQPVSDAAPQNGCTGVTNCYSVYAHSDHELYVVDLKAKTLMDIGPFTPTGSNIVVTDLAVAPDNTIYVISESALYTASAIDGHITKVGTLSTCGAEAVALTTTPDGRLWTADFMGTICQIDISVSPPVVKPPVTMSDHMALSGDLVAVDNGTVYGTAYDLSGTQSNNVLVTVDLVTGTVTKIGASGYPRLYGTSFAFGKVIAFTHDGTGRVVQIDTATGLGSMFATFTDPTTGTPISFAGAGVNSLITPVLQ